MTTRRATDQKLTEYYRILELRPGASRDELRQAYRDLARVWHPDRFTADPRLERIAGRRLAEINEAYRALLKYCVDQQPAPARPQSAPPATSQPARAESTPTTDSECPAASAAPARAWRRRLQRVYPQRRSLAGLTPVLAAICTAAIVVLGVNSIYRALRASAVAVTGTLSGGRAQGPPIPDSILPTVDPNWFPHVITRYAAPVPNSDSEDTPVPASGQPQPLRRRLATAVRVVRPENGAELVRPEPRGGIGRVAVENQTASDAVADLVDSIRHTAVRSLYVRARNKVVIENVPVGVYSVRLAFGEEWNGGARIFRKPGGTVPEIGPLQFLRYSSVDGTRSDAYSIVLKPEPQMRVPRSDD